ncbi:hypothetical protein ACFL3V_07100 [Nanoarchaeota archaeon]
MKNKMLRFPDRARRSKKAQVETQLNWIFILIVGAVILAFFAFIVIKQRAAAEAKFSGKIAQQLNTIFTGAKVASGTVQEIPTPEVSIRFDCNDYYIGPTSQRMGNRVVFAPEFVEGKKIITWTRDWNVPFKISSFLYVTAPTVRYIVIGEEADEPKANALYDALPDKLNKDIFSLNDYEMNNIVNEDDKYVRFILVDISTLNIPTAFDDVSVTGLEVDTSLDPLYSAKSVKFLARAASAPRTFNTGATHYYTEEEVMYGAIFSDNSDEYECIMRRAYERFNIVARVYKEKLDALASAFDGSNCEGFYENNQDIAELIGSTNQYPGEQQSYDAIVSTKAGLKDSNTRLQLYSCPLIY